MGKMVLRILPGAKISRVATWEKAKAKIKKGHFDLLVADPFDYGDQTLVMIRFLGTKKRRKFRGLRVVLQPVMQTSGVNSADWDSLANYWSCGAISRKDLERCVADMGFRK